MEIDSSNMDCESPLTPNPLRHSTNTMNTETKTRPRTSTPKKSELKTMLDKVMAVQRDGTILRSASESLLWKRRQKGKKGKNNNNNNRGSPLVPSKDTKRMSDQSYLN